MAEVPVDPIRIIERFGPHLSAMTGARLSTSAEPDRLVKTHCCFCGQQCGIQLKVRDNEVEMARSLIDSLTEPWNPEGFKDEYREALLEIVEKKVAGEPIEVPTEEAPARVVDLMEALKASVAAAKSKTPSSSGGARRGGSKRSAAKKPAAKRATAAKKPATRKKASGE